MENLTPGMSIAVAAAGTAALLRPGDRLPLTHAATMVRFDAGSCTYELEAALARVPEIPPPPADCADGLTATYRPVDLALTNEQRLLVLALAEQRLSVGSQGGVLPSNAELAERLGWSVVKFNRKLDWLCQRMHRAGVPGMRANGRRANGRRLHLIEHVVAGGVVTFADLDDLYRHEAMVASTPTSS